jgi:hypothetical protein
MILLEKRLFDLILIFQIWQADFLVNNLFA